jgi:hypothetical protein
MKKFLTIALVASLTSITCAETWTVDDDGPADFDTIQKAIDMASSGDVIMVFPGIYRNDLGTFDPIADFNGKSLTLISRDGADVTIIDAQDQMSPIVIGNTLDVSIPHKVEGFTIRNGMGGGISVVGDCILKVGFCTIEGCREPAIWSHGRVTLTVAECTIKDNDSTYLSGGIVTGSGSVLLYNTVFANNYSDTLGGALRLWGSHDLTDSADIIGCTFDNNEASQGAAISAHELAVRIEACQFLENTGGQGTVAYLQHNTLAEIVDSYFCSHDPDDIEGKWHDLGGNIFESTCAGACPGDFDGNGQVDGADLTVLLSDWGGCPGCTSDLDGNGTVNGADLTILLSNWGTC